ncbi:PAN2-PAN3 deadenylation complex subunit PAN3 isoform X1 [Phlebotomus argentipes]|uniref:PAN2-PAN3 deadenylation complex subunit PAN3 isoform X1 n=1 Tax=Phlebotomus argentipes TaxID=94469 RepID=UPI0028930B65|nr:PAN2-PAN3 deadenylation complex subunit PAN3 isoform X1 [Phlebotomus argentipes]XP_059620156.1 PAN2-PAN3 deadenylation complex subunit PAN3 isoform X1 [Phlebotomus argentipes]XP_059620157.1 PAN2-PAN3 deadenylation complex subunit PAN3 isoform X1 [Phlebotomus argentipes]
MDQIFYSPLNGVPSESKLATYMSRQNVTTPTYGLSSGITKLSLESPISTKKTQVTPQSPEFIPRLNSSPSFYSPYSSVIANGGGGSNGGVVVPPIVAKPTSVLGAPCPSTVYNAVTPIKSRNLMRGDSPQSTNDSPRLTPQPSPPPTTAIHQENVGGTTYFYPAAAAVAQTTTSQACSSTSSDTNGRYGHHSSAQMSLSYSHPGHVYPGPASSVLSLQPKTLLSSAFFMPAEMRSSIQGRNAISNNMETGGIELPLEVDNYHGLCPLEPMAVNLKLPVPASSYKATHSNTGVKYFLRRIHGFRLQSAKFMSVVEMWKKLQHSNVVQLREVFTTKAFGDHSLVLVYDYHPGSQTLLSKYFTPSVETNGYADPFSGEARPFSHKSSLQRTVNGPMLAENEIWFIIMQLTAGLRAIHQSGLACRTLDPTKIIVTGRRVRFSCLGISDIVSFDPNQANQLAVISHYQQEDLTSLGKLVLALACRCLHSIHRDQVQASIELVARHYSSDLRNLILYLLTTTNRRAVSDLMPMIGARFYIQLDALQTQCDMQDDELAKEMENGRLYRLLVKLGCINERPELNMDVTWSETGDRYMLKLFRDYLFHSVSEDGRPWMDHAHIVQCLNKLDAGTMERVQLMSRDEQSVLVVTYAELKHCLEQAFGELAANA